MTQAAEQILNGLNALMQRQGALGDKFPGHPFVVSENEFGINCGPLNGSLYAMHHLIDSFERTGFFEGTREPRTDLDTMAYEFGLGETKIYEGVIAKRTPAAITLTIKTHRSVDETVKALQAGVDAAQERLDQRQREAAQYAQMVRDEFAKEDVAPLFSKKLDIEFVKGYLKSKTDGYFKGNPNTKVEGPFPSRKYSEGIFSEYGVTDRRPRFEVRFAHTEDNFAPFNDFHNTVLGDVFTAPLAVNVDQNQRVENGISFSINGNPSRLARDIVNNDPELAITTLYENANREVASLRGQGLKGNKLARRANREFRKAKRQEATLAL